VSNYCHEQKSLNSDGQQFHQYQQNNYFSPQIIEDLYKQSFGGRILVGESSHGRGMLK
jgi:hypothetical protein